ncbi:MAG: cysteine desulfurase [Bacteroidetes bacterium]|nr:cysteine desulfurase [Bacteroidota bacterium]
MPQGELIYLDNNATTRVDEEVLNAMLPFFTEHYGNASSALHQYGWRAAEAVKIAREQTASILSVTPEEIYFTASATEAINMALVGLHAQYSAKRNKIVTVKTEHKAVLETCIFLQQMGAEIIFLDVNRQGLIDIKELEKTVDDKTSAVCIMWANNETGVLQPLAAFADIAHRHGAIFMSDTTQAIGKVRVDLNEMGVDIACVSAHKFYGPKGVGAIYLRRKNPRVILPTFIYGGGQESKLRAGTLNVPGIVGLGKACEVAMGHLWNYGADMSRLRIALEQQLCANHHAFVNGTMRDRLPNTSNICLQSLAIRNKISAMSHLAISTGSACASALAEPSHVLLAMGLSNDEAFNSIRFSFGRYNTMEEVRIVTDFFNNLVPSA